MAEASSTAEAQSVAAGKKKGGKKLILLVLLLLLLIGGGGAAFMFVPAVHDKITGLIGGGAPSAKKEAEAIEEKPYFVEIPEITVTMPNAGRARQLRIKIALELAKHPGAEGGKEEKKDSATNPDVLSPRVYDGLVLYLRTLRDAEVDGALSIDRMRGDLQRRLDLLLGDGVLKDVLITSLIIG
jgi:flagellar FliL protein